MAIIVILCGAPHLYKKDMNNSGLFIIISLISTALANVLRADQKNTGSIDPVFRISYSLFRVSESMIYFPLRSFITSSTPLSVTLWEPFFESIA